MIQLTLQSEMIMKNPRDRDVIIVSEFVRTVITRVCNNDVSTDWEVTVELNLNIQ